MVRPVIALAAIAVIASTAALGQMSEQDRLQRCANNQARIDELNSQIQVDPDFISNADTQQLLNDIKLARYLQNGMHFSESAEGDEATVGDAVRRFGVSRSCVASYNCMASVVLKLNKRLTRGALARKRLAPQLRQLANHERNLVALHCTGGTSTETPQRGWVSEGTGDCPGDDKGSSNGREPDPGMCTVDGLAAICWDGVQYHNNYDKRPTPWCTYKTISQERCSGGSNIGFAYRCRVPR